MKLKNAVPKRATLLTTRSSRLNLIKNSKIQNNCLVNRPSTARSRALYATTAKATKFESFEEKGPHYLEKTFDKILIANRGEIAVRIIKSCRNLGIKTVAVYSEADQNSLHVRLADEAVCIGPAASSESYLNVDKILDAIRKTGAKAVHPGYGFLSENYQFCEALESAGIVFIGPNHQSILDMGDKIRSKAIAKSAGVFIIPGFQGVVENAEHAVQIAKDIGYPVMLKASAGGGGKGMRVAYSDEEVKENFVLASSESQRSFGDARLLIEKFIEEPRHIEIQIIGDQFGNLLYLPERECSIQRRNQKVIEEAPSTFLSTALRQSMGEQAVALAKRVGYFSAGTVEFLVDKHKKFYFLEMNTRLQVEHPITELITGVDLVELMILVAAKLPIPFTQEEMNSRLKGWAIESRVYAEHPETYLPSIGTLSLYREPAVLPTDNFTIRCDSGIVEGSEISMYYDSMICKLSVFGETREIARQGMIQALDKYLIEGVTHNIPLLREVLSNSDFVAGRTNTAFLSAHFPTGFKGHLLSMIEKSHLLASAILLHWRLESVKGQLPSKTTYILEFQSESHYVSIERKKNNFKVIVGDHALILGLEEIISECLFRFTNVKSNESFIVQFVHNTGDILAVHLRIFGSLYNVKIYSPKEKQLLGFLPEPKVLDTSKLLVSPMPGSILSVTKTVGETVIQGTELMVIEAMKMQNVIRAPCDGIIKAVHYQKGDSVGSQDVLVEFE